MTWAEHNVLAQVLTQSPYTLSPRTCFLRDAKLDQLLKRVHLASSLPTFSNNLNNPAWPSLFVQTLRIQRDPGLFHWIRCGRRGSCAPPRP